MIERRKLESLAIEILETDWLFGFVCEITLNLIINGEPFAVEKRAIDMQFKNIENEMKKEFLSGKLISCVYNKKNVKIQYKDGWVYIANE